jgi:hypothetical protein
MHDNLEAREIDEPRQESKHVRRKASDYSCIHDSTEMLKGRARNGGYTREEIFLLVADHRLQLNPLLPHLVR